MMHIIFTIILEDLNWKLQNLGKQKNKVLDEKVEVREEINYY